MLTHVAERGSSPLAYFPAVAKLELSIKSGAQNLFQVSHMMSEL